MTGNRDSGSATTVHFGHWTTRPPTTRFPACPSCAARSRRQGHARYAGRPTVEPLTPTPRRRLSAPSREPITNQPQTPDRGGLTDPAPFRDDPQLRQETWRTWAIVRLRWSRCWRPLVWVGRWRYRQTRSSPRFLPGVASCAAVSSAAGELIRCLLPRLDATRALTVRGLANRAAGSLYRTNRLTGQQDQQHSPKPPEDSGQRPPTARSGLSWRPAGCTRRVATSITNST